MKILQFSGGVDSLACLLLLENERGLSVVTAQTDGAYASTRDYLARVQREFPQHRFLTFRTERYLPLYGYPVDVVPLRYTALGQLFRGESDTLYQDSFSCCHRALWEPMDKFCRALGATVIYRGQRKDDRLRAPLEDGFVDNGITIRLPVAEWNRGQVWDYVRAHAAHLIPPGYGEGELTSRDCVDCTAYLQDNRQRIRNLPPEARVRVEGIIERWRADVRAEMETAHG